MLHAICESRFGRFDRSREYAEKSYKEKMSYTCEFKKRLSHMVYLVDLTERNRHRKKIHISQILKGIFYTFLCSSLTEQKSSISEQIENRLNGS